MTKDKEFELKRKLIEMNGWAVSPDDLEIEIKNKKLICKLKEPVELTFISMEGKE